MFIAELKRSAKIMKYWIRINGGEHGPYTEAEIISHFGVNLPCNVLCAAVGENKWSKLGEILPSIGSGAPIVNELNSDQISDENNFIAKKLTNHFLMVFYMVIFCPVLLPLIYVIQYTEYETAGFIGIVSYVSLVLFVHVRCAKVCRMNPELSVIQVFLRAIYLQRSSSTYSNPFTSELK